MVTRRYVLTNNLLSRLVSNGHGITKIYCYHCNREIKLLQTVQSVTRKNTVHLYHNRCFKKTHFVDEPDLKPTKKVKSQSF